MKSLAVPTLQATAQTEQREKKKTKQKKTLQFIVACRIMAYLITPFLCEGIIARDITREKRGIVPTGTSSITIKVVAALACRHFLIDPFEKHGQKKQATRFSKIYCGARGRGEEGLRYVTSL